MAITNHHGFYVGNARMLRDRIARALPAWSPSMAGYHAVLGMHAFGLEECADYVGVEAQGRAAVELEPRDGWEQHAVAHVMEMQCRQADGIAWMRANPDAWSTDSFFKVHPLTLAIKAFGEARYGETVRLIRPVREIAHRFGGSHAQRDLLNLTLIEAALRSGQQALAAGLCAERLTTRPYSPLTRQLVARAEPLRAAA